MKNNLIMHHAEVDDIAYLDMIYQFKYLGMITAAMKEMFNKEITGLPVYVDQDWMYWCVDDGTTLHMVISKVMMEGAGQCLKSEIKLIYSKKIKDIIIRSISTILRERGSEEIDNFASEFFTNENVHFNCSPVGHTASWLNHCRKEIAGAKS